MSRTRPTDAEFADLLVSHVRLVYWLAARRFGGDQDRVQDVAQDTFLLAWRKRDRYDPARAKPDASNPFACWLRLCFRAALSHRSDGFRRQKRSGVTVPLSAAVACPSPAPRPDQEVADAEARKVVRAAVVALPHRRRSRLIRHHYKRQTFAAIGERDGVSRQAAELDVNKGVGQLAARVRPQLTQRRHRPTGVYLTA